MITTKPATATSWKRAVWEALQQLASGGTGMTRQQIVTGALPGIVARIGSRGKTPEQTLSRVLQELRDDGLIIFDGGGIYRLAQLVSAMPLEQALVTEMQALINARRGQSVFRTRLLERWSARCPLTNIREPALLRASHIVPWNECEAESERLEPDNGILLSVMWDAAFDRRLVSFDDTGMALRCVGLTDVGLAMMKASGRDRIEGLTTGNRERLKWHRARCQLA